MRNLNPAPPRKTLEEWLEEFLDKTRTPEMPDHQVTDMKYCFVSGYLTAVMEASSALSGDFDLTDNERIQRIENMVAECGEKMKEML